jgi:hydrogenase nickel incorporation protein HypB
MCDQCGCGQPEEHTHRDGDGHDHGEGHTHKTIDVGQAVLAHNKAHAQSLRERLIKQDSRLVNIIGSPGCGKTGLIAALLGVLADRLHCVVVEGDLATDNDAARIRVTGTPVYQIETGTACHLSAHDVEHAIDHLPTDQPRSLIIVENVGNLVCPSMFDLGESLRVVCLSVPEGTDKPEKYPVAFREADLVLITKHDLLEYVDFDLDSCLKMIEEIKPGLPCLVTSARQVETLEPLADQLLKMWD